MLKTQLRRKGKSSKVVIYTKAQKTSNRGQKQNKKKKKPKRSVNHNSRSAITPAGTAFLKCSMAPADFSIVPNFSGIPDEYDGYSVVRNLNLTSSLPDYEPGNDLYIIQMPIPGVAYLHAQRPPGLSPSSLTVWYPVFYDGISSMFPFGNENVNANSFRFASNVLEVISTANEMTVAGSVHAWKSQVNMGHDMKVAPGSPFFTESPFIEGVSAILSTKPQSCFPLCEGIYIPAFNSQSTYPWTPILTGCTFSEMNNNQLLGPTSDRFFQFGDDSTTPFLGLGSFETSIIKIPAATVGQSCIIRAWCCLELQIPETSVVYDYRHLSPTYDPVALALLKKYRSTLTTAVTWKQNATFWQNFIKWSRTILKGVSYIPGPLGIIAKSTLDIADSGISF